MHPNHQNAPKRTHTPRHDQNAPKMHRNAPASTNPTRMHPNAPKRSECTQMHPNAPEPTRMHPNAPERTWATRMHPPEKRKKGERANDRTTSRNTTLIPPADLRGRGRHSLFLVTNALPQLWVLYLTPLSMDDSRLRIDQTADYGLKWHGIGAGIR